MKIGVSNMSWDISENDILIPIIKENNYDYIESVYSKITSEFPIYAIQSIFYGSGITDLKGSKSLKHIEKVVEDAHKIGAGVITFGSPTMRVGGKEKMLRFLSGVNKIVDGTGIKFCIEPNSKHYGAEYYTTLESIVNDIDKFENLTSMIDVGNSLLEGQDVFEEYDKYKDYVSHIHFAAPGLIEIQDYSLYNNFYKYLKYSGYDNFISYEFGSAINKELTISNFYERIIK